MEAAQARVEVIHRRGWAMAGIAGVLIVAFVTGARAEKFDGFVPATSASLVSQPITGASDRESVDDVKVTGLRFSGDVSLLSASERVVLEAGGVGLPLTLESLQTIADETTYVVQAKGHLLARAYLPPQDVTDGVVEIALVHGTVEAWDFEGHSAESERRDHLHALARAAVAPRQSVTSQRLERALLLMGDHSGTSVGARLAPGNEPNTSRIIVTLAEGDPVTANGSLDNYGSPATGRLQTNFVVHSRNVLNRGERVGFATVVTQGTDMVRVDGAVPVGASGLNLSGHGMWMQYRVIEGAGAVAELAGHTRQAQLELLYPMVRSRQANVNGRLFHTRRTTTDLALGFVLRERAITSTGLVFSGDTVSVRDQGGQTTWELRYVTGHVAVVHGVDVDDSAGRFDKATGSLQRVQRLRTPWTWVAGVGGQWAGANLDSSEQFSLGGPDGIRAYPVGEGSGDLGWRTTVELRYDRSPAWLRGQMQWALFVDHGWVQLHHTPVGAIATATGKNAYSLTGAGMSLTWHLPSDVVVQLGWAHAIGDNPGRTIFGTHADGTMDSSRLWTRAGLRF